MRKQTLSFCNVNGVMNEKILTFEKNMTFNGASKFSIRHDVGFWSSSLSVFCHYNYDLLKIFLVYLNILFYLASISLYFDMILFIPFKNCNSLHFLYDSMKIKHSFSKCNVIKCILHSLNIYKKYSTLKRHFCRVKGLIFITKCGKRIKSSQ